MRGVSRAAPRGLCPPSPLPRHPSPSVHLGSPCGTSLSPVPLCHPWGHPILPTSPVPPLHIPHVPLPPPGTPYVPHPHPPRSATLCPHSPAAIPSATLCPIPCAPAATTTALMSSPWPLLPHGHQRHPLPHMPPVPCPTASMGKGCQPLGGLGWGGCGGPPAGCRQGAAPQWGAGGGLPHGTQI